MPEAGGAILNQSRTSSESKKCSCIAQKDAGLALCYASVAHTPIPVSIDCWLAGKRGGSVASINASLTCTDCLARGRGSNRAQMIVAALLVSRQLEQRSWSKKQVAK